MSVEEKILTQVEFYFSDSNLPNDKFLRGIVEKNEGFVPIETVASFKKMQSLTKDIKVVTEALRKSEKLVVSEDGTKVKRSTPLPEKVDFTPQSIYAKGFPKEYSLEQINEYFTQHLEGEEKILCTRMRRFKDKNFKGSVFVELNSAEAAQRIAKLTLTAPTTEAEPLLLHMKADYLAKKAEEQKQRKDKKRPRDGEAEPKKEEFKRDITLDCIVKVSALAEGCMREDIKGAFEAAGCKVTFVEFNKGNSAGYVRLDKESEVKASAAVAKMTEDKVQIKEASPELSALTGEEEAAYWKKVFDAQEAKKKMGGKGKRQRK